MPVSSSARPLTAVSRALATARIRYCQRRDAVHAAARTRNPAPQPAGAALGVPPPRHSMRRIATLAASHVRHRGGGGNYGYRSLMRSGAT
jgi:hypothetical protein